MSKYVSYQEIEEVRVLDKIKEVVEVTVELKCTLRSEYDGWYEQGWGAEFEVESVHFENSEYRNLDVLKTLGEVIFDSIIDNAIQEACDTGEF